MSARPHTRLLLFFWALLLAAPALFGLARPAWAQIGSERYSSVVVEAGSGSVLSAASAEEPRHPASLAKLMTLYMTFEALRDRRIAMGQLVPISYHAALMSPSKLGLAPGSQLTVEQAVLGLVTKSANDAAAALGELLGGDEDRFAQMMTLRARALGMRRTTFTNASGLPDPDQWTTAQDMAVLARRILIDFPGYYGFFSTPSFVFHGRVILNHDRMLQTYPGADGMKTGWTQASGHNLVTSASRGGVRLIGVVLGAQTNAERDEHMALLLDQGFERLDVPRPDVPGARVQQATRMPSFIQTAQAASLTTPVIRAARAAPTRVAIQVGSFGSERAAREAALLARRTVEGGDARVEPVSIRGKTAWRAQLSGLSAAEAQGVCSALTRRRSPCVVLRSEPGQFASR